MAYTTAEMTVLIKCYKDASFFSTQQVLKYLKEAGFRIGKISQALIPGELPETILDDYGRGAFVVIRSVKQDAPLQLGR